MKDFEALKIVVAIMVAELHQSESIGGLLLRNDTSWTHHRHLGIAVKLPVVEDAVYALKNFRHSGPEVWLFGGLGMKENPDFLLVGPVPYCVCDGQLVTTTQYCQETIVVDFCTHRTKASIHLQCQTLNEEARKEELKDIL